ncbi:hypothetical protein ACS0PU_012904 [Formica fusca]
MRCIRNDSSIVRVTAIVSIFDGVSENCCRVAYINWVAYIHASHAYTERPHALITRRSFYQERERERKREIKVQPGSFVDSAHAIPILKSVFRAESVPRIRRIINKRLPA